MQEHPLVIFRDGPAGRRARIVSGPDIWEVIGAIQSALDTEPELSADEIVKLVGETTGLESQQVRAALAYWADYPAEVDDLLQRSRAATDQAFVRWERERELFAR